jgi:hypothetical protein
MKKLIAISFVFVFLLAGCSWFGQGNADGLKEAIFKTDTGDHKFYVEVADDSDERQLGLMHRESLDADKGMIFVYEEEQRVAFWMKNTLIPLDMVFLDDDLEVIDYFTDVPPCKADPCPHYIPQGNAKFIIELNAGKISEIGLKRGDKVEYK